MLWDTADANFTAIKDAFFNGTSVEFAVMDGDIATAGSQGLRASMAITAFSRNEPLEEAMSVSVTASRLTRRIRPNGWSRYSRIPP